VQVSRVDLDGRKIDFRLVRDGEDERLLARGRGGERGHAAAGDALEEVRRSDRAARSATRTPRGAAAGTRKSKSGASGTAAKPRATTGPARKRR
ncbi:MAG: ribonuclease R, partial [Gammaproteobacteria bacterium]